MSDSFADLQDAAVRFRDERDWRQFHRPKDLALGVVTEAGELAELFLWKTDAELEAALQEPRFRERLADEMADVQVFLLYLADRSGLSLPASVLRKLEKNALKYPVHRSRGSSRKYDDVDRP